MNGISEFYIAYCVLWGIVIACVIGVCAGLIMKVFKKPLSLVA
jgi:hypothetical protein